MKVLRRFCTLDVSVCVYSLDGESCECELCFGGRMVGGVGGSCDEPSFGGSGGALALQGR